MSMEPKDFPLAPRTFESTGLSLRQITGLVLKSMYSFGHETLLDLAGFIKLPPLVLARAMGFMEDLDYVEKLGSENVRPGVMRYRLSQAGRRAAADEMELDRYVGPAPVCLTDYRNQIGRQSLSNEEIDLDRIKAGLKDIVMSDEMFNILGPAVVDGHSCLMYGPPGNGKSMVSQAIVNIYSDVVYIPYALTVGEEVIRVFDPTVHRPAEADVPMGASEGKRGDLFDERWVPCHRPLVVTGGELNLSMLDLTYNTLARTYNASLQLKANSGVIVIDDFGRQMARPSDILNRWIIPLEEGHDYLNLATGGSFQVPFDAFVIFSTNLDTETLFDDATRRRIQYKMTFEAPSREEFVELLQGQLPNHPAEEVERVTAYLYRKYFDTELVEPARFHPKWVVHQAKALCRFKGIDFVLEDDMLDRAIANL